MLFWLLNDASDGLGGHLILNFLTYAKYLIATFGVPLFPHKYISFNLGNILKLWSYTWYLQNQILSLVLMVSTLIYLLYFFMWTIFLKSLLNLLQYCFYFFVFSFFGCKACEILGPQPGIDCQGSTSQSLIWKKLVSLSTLIENACFSWRI